MSSRRILHYLSMAHPGGVERHCADFVVQAAQQYPQWQASVLVAGPKIHPYLRTQVQTVADIAQEKYWRGYKLPNYPAGLRHRWRKRVFSRAQPELVVIWNRPARSQALLQLVGQQPWVYWEHGAAWWDQDEPVRRDFFRQTALALVNSNAARRVLELRWGYTGKIQLCLNALRPSVKPINIAPKTLPQQRPLRLGVAGRLTSLKGSVLALHAVKILLDQHCAVELHIAGQGGLLPQLQALARQLGIAQHIVWHGLLDAMADFYRTIDCLLHPALREPFGLVCIEAAAYGCPVITAAVDGLPEAVQHERSGFCLEPQLSLHEYRALGGTLEGLPRYVYSPRQDQLVTPQCVDPGQLADTVLRLLGNAAEYGQLSQNAINSVNTAYDFTKHVDTVIGTLAHYTGH